MPPTEAVQAQLKQLPPSPGCYIYRDEKQEVLYVGKAVNLKNRVRSYFRASANHGNRIARMVRKIADIEWIIVDSELEALVLECNLIKKHRPPFNVRLRDDKSYPYIVITKENFPRVMFTRNPRKGSGKIFGPYASAWAVRDTLTLLHKVFPLIPCGKSYSGRAEQKPCLYYHLHQCLAPCAGLANRQEYGTVLHDVEQFLGGKGDALVDDLRAKMEKAAEALEFERAATLRDQITSIEGVMSRQKVLNPDATDQDVIAVVKDDRGAAVQMLYIRHGRLIGQRQFYLDGAGDAAPADAVGEFVKQYYAEAPEVPQEVLLPVEIVEKHIVEQWLRQRRGSSVTVTVPQGGDKMRLIDLAAQNAEDALGRFASEMTALEAFAEKASTQLQEALDLPTLPARVECYDISNIQGKSPVGSMVVTLNGASAKEEYRRFKIRYNPEDPNDFAMMAEVITRRLKAFVDGDPKFTPLPDLLVVDGGKGQLSVALEVRDKMGLTVPMVGLAKKMEIIFVPHRVGDGYGFTGLELPLDSPGLLLLRRLRDEAHRFALTYHRKLRDKRFHGSALEEIPGVGPRRRRLLLRAFGSLEAIRRASVEDLAAVPTMTTVLASRIRDFFRDEEAASEPETEETP